MKAQALLAILKGAYAIYTEAVKALDTLKQNKEMTPEEEAQFNAANAEMMAQPHWKKSTDTEG